MESVDNRRHDNDIGSPAARRRLRASSTAMLEMSLSLHPSSLAVAPLNTASLSAEFLFQLDLDIPDMSWDTPKVMASCDASFAVDVGNCVGTGDGGCVGDVGGDGGPVVGEAVTEGAKVGELVGAKVPVMAVRIRTFCEDDP